MQQQPPPFHNNDDDDDDDEGVLLDRDQPLLSTPVLVAHSPSMNFMSRNGNSNNNFLQMPPPLELTPAAVGMTMQQQQQQQQQQHQQLIGGQQQQQQQAFQKPSAQRSDSILSTESLEFVSSSSSTSIRHNTKTNEQQQNAAHHYRFMEESSMEASWTAASFCNPSVAVDVISGATTATALLLKGSNPTVDLLQAPTPVRVVPTTLDGTAAASGSGHRRHISSSSGSSTIILHPSGPLGQRRPDGSMTSQDVILVSHNDDHDNVESNSNNNDVGPAAIVEKVESSQPSASNNKNNNKRNGSGGGGCRLRSVSNGDAVVLSPTRRNDDDDNNDNNNNNADAFIMESANIPAAVAAAAVTENGNLSLPLLFHSSIDASVDPASPAVPPTSLVPSPPPPQPIFPEEQEHTTTRSTPFPTTSNSSTGDQKVNSTISTAATTALAAPPISSTPAAAAAVPLATTTTTTITKEPSESSSPTAAPAAADVDRIWKMLETHQIIKDITRPTPPPPPIVSLLDDDNNEEYLNCCRNLDEAMALHRVLQNLTRPSLSLESCLAALTLEKSRKYNNNTCSGQQQQQNDQAARLPDQPIIHITSPAAATPASSNSNNSNHGHEYLFRHPVIALLLSTTTTASSSSSYNSSPVPLLLHFPVHFGLAFLRLLTRLLTHETDDEYNASCLYTVSAEAASPSIWSSTTMTAAGTSKNNTSSSSFTLPSAASQSTMSRTAAASYTTRRIMSTSSGGLERSPSLSMSTTSKLIMMVDSQLAEPDHATRRPHLLYSVARLNCCCSSSAGHGRHNNRNSNNNIVQKNKQDNAFVTTEHPILASTVLWLLERTAVLAKDEPPLSSLLSPLARLLGVVSVAGVNPRILRRMMVLVGQQQQPQSTPATAASVSLSSSSSCPSLPMSVRLSLVRALTTAAAGAARPRVLQKMPPRHFFLLTSSSSSQQPNYNGSSRKPPMMQRIIKGFSTWPFRNDFGMATWFRAEGLQGDDDDQNTDNSRSANQRAPILLSARAIGDDEDENDHHGGGLEVSFVPLGSSAYTIAVSLFHAGQSTPAHRLEVSGCVLLPRVWYHVAVRHTRSRLKGVFSLSTRQQLSILLDGKTMLNESLPFPRVGQNDFDLLDSSSLLASGLRRTSSVAPARLNLNIKIGVNFDGQLSSVYIFKENVSDASFRALYEATGGRDRAVKRSMSLGDGWDSRHTDIVRKSRVLDVRIKSDDAEEIVLSRRRPSLSRGLLWDEKNVAVIDFGEGEDHEENEIPVDLQTAAFGSKIFCVWDPRRTLDGQALELHLGMHLDMNGVHSWSCRGAQDVVASIGGVQALIPLFRSTIAAQVGNVSESSAAKSDTKCGPFPILSDLLLLLTSFVRDHDDNAREFLRCGGIDVIEQLFLASKKAAVVVRPRQASLWGAMCTDLNLASQLVSSLLKLRSACNHYVGLETKVFSRLVFNLPLWLGGASQSQGVALHLTILPLLSSVAKNSPDKVRDCVGVKDMVHILREYNSVNDNDTDQASGTMNRFQLPNICDTDVSTPLSQTERRYVSLTMLGMIFEVLVSGSSPGDLGPLLHFMSSALDVDWHDTEKGQGVKDKDSSKLRTLVDVCTAFTFLLQVRPPVAGVFESFAHVCGSVQGGIGWILSVMVNSFDDRIRSLGVRCVVAYLDATARNDDSPLTLGTSTTVSDPDANPVLETSTVARASSRVASLAKGLAAMGPGVRGIVLSQSKLTSRVVYKLLWHLLKSHRTDLGPKTRKALLYCITDAKETMTNTMLSADYLRNNLIVRHDDVEHSAWILDNDWADNTLDESGDIVGRSIQNKLMTGTVLRLLRYLEPETREQWLSEIITLAKASRKSISLLSTLPEWQPCLFHLVSDTIERLSSAALVQNQETELSMLDERSKRCHRLDLCLQIYASLLGHLLREGGEKALDAVENTASLQRVCVNGHVALLLILSALCTNLFENGTLLEMGSISAEDWKDVDLDQDSLLLKQSAKLVTDAILSNGTKGLDMTSAIRSWRSLRHLAEVVVVLTARSGLGVVDLFDYSVHRASAVESVSGGLYGIRLPDSGLPGVGASEFVEFLGVAGGPKPRTHEVEEEASSEVDKRLCVVLSAQILTLLDAFIFPESLDASLPASQLHGLALVRNSEPRLGASQGPLITSAIRLSFLLLSTLEPCSVRFLQCASRLRCLLYWALELVRESTAQDGSPSAFQDSVASMDRILLAVVLHCHRALGRCASLLNEIESASHEIYFPSKEAQKKCYRRLVRVALELRHVVSAAYRGRNDVMRRALSPKAFEELRSSLEGTASSKKAPSKESVARDFLSSPWVTNFQDVETRADLAVPEQVTMEHIPLSSNDVADAAQGFVAVEKLAQESNSIQTDFEKALNSCFEQYLDAQRRWAETDAVRDLEYDGDTTFKRLSEKLENDVNEIGQTLLARRIGADSRWRGIQRKCVTPWSQEPYWKLAEYTDRLARRTLLVENRNFTSHKDAAYDTATSGEADGAMSDSQKGTNELTDVIRRNAEAFIVVDSAADSDSMDDDSLVPANEDSSDGESTTDLESSTDADSVDPVDVETPQNEADESEHDEGWDKIDTEEIQHVAADGDVDGWAKAFIWSDSEQAVARFEPIMIVSLQRYVEGKILLTTHGLYFHQLGDEINVMTKKPVDSNDAQGSEGRDRRWRLNRLTEVHGRRYLLRPQAMELFFSDSHELFLNFPGGPKERDRFHAKLRNSCKVPMLWSPKSLSPRVVFRKSQLSELWRRRKISNFQYLMALNRMAGRSFNDLTQYPVFPWVLADYTSENIDLNDSRVYRDLTKPIGALNPSRLAQLIERYKDLELFGFPEAERFLYGSHYSSPGIVLHYLIRQEPFTTMAIELQSGRFDCPDRLFFDLASSWNSCMVSSSDMKELIPEFYCLPEMFLNTNKFPLGKMQSGRNVDDVGLPPWAKGSAFEFVRIHRLALESEYVSQNLHHWIDLIFGYKQRGVEAEAAHNIFHHLSYEGSVDLDKIHDEIDRQAAESHIQNFGQTPSQLSPTEPHVARYSLEECWKPLIYDLKIPTQLRCHTPSKQFGNSNNEFARGPVVKIHVFSDYIAAIYEDMSVGTYRWFPATKNNILRMDRLRPLARRELSTSRFAMKRGSAIPQTERYRGDYSIGNYCFDFTIGGRAREEQRRNAVLPSNRLIAGTETSLSTVEASAKLVSCGYWDNTIKVHGAESWRLMSSKTGGHSGPVRCLRVEQDGLMITGGADGTCRVWVVDHADMAVALSDGYVQTALGASNDGEKLLSCCHVLWGHETPITCVDLNSDLDIAVSGSESGLICVHTVRRGDFVRSIRPPVVNAGSTSIAASIIALDSTGNFAVHMEDGGLHTFTINGVHLCGKDAGETLHDMKICSFGEILVTGGDRCQVSIRKVVDLRICATLDLTRHGPIRCIALTPDHLNPIGQFLFIGSEDGSITIIDKDPDALIQKDSETTSF